jgi:uncharacterized protein YndB with AHSA1/START domain
MRERSNGMALEFELSAVIPAPRETVSAAWLDSAAHSAMTGGRADVSAAVGGSFEAWDGYIRGRNLVLEPGRRIVQSWRTVEFQDSEPDSQIEITFEDAAGGAKITLRHTNLPPHGGQYQQGWVDNYFDPMTVYFESVG